MKNYLMTILYVGAFPMLLLCQESYVKVEIMFVKKGYDGYEQFAIQAAHYLERIVNSKEFETKVTKGIFKRKNGYTNKEIHQTIMDGFEKQCPEKKEKKLLYVEKVKEV